MYIVYLILHTCNFLVQLSLVQFFSFVIFVILDWKVIVKKSVFCPKLIFQSTASINSYVMLICNISFSILQCCSTIPIQGPFTGFFRRFQTYHEASNGFRADKDYLTRSKTLDCVRQNHGGKARQRTAGRNQNLIRLLHSSESQAATSHDFIYYSLDGNNSLTHPCYLRLPLVLLQVGILYFQPSVFRCILLRWVRLLGFATVYGTLTLKLYRYNPHTHYTRTYTKPFVQHRSASQEMPEIGLH